MPRQRHLVTLGAIRPHHFHYPLDDVHFVNQRSSFPTTQHTFFIPMFTGDWKVYYAAFDTGSPQTAHSISPIWAHEYSANIYTTPTITSFDTQTGGPSCQVGDWLILFNPQPQGNPVPELTALGCTRFVILADQLDTSIVWSATPPHNEVSHQVRMHRAYVLQVDSLPVAFSTRYTGWRIRGLPAHQIPTRTSVKLLTGLNWSAASPLSEPFSQPVDLQAGHVAVFYQVGFGSATITHESPATAPQPRLFTTPFADYTGNMETNPWSFATFTNMWTTFRLGVSSLNFAIDITRVWRKLPGNPLPFPE